MSVVVSVISDATASTASVAESAAPSKVGGTAVMVPVPPWLSGIVTALGSTAATPVSVVFVGAPSVVVAVAVVALEPPFASVGVTGCVVGSVVVCVETVAG